MPAGVILAGGEGRRLGEDKSATKLLGVSLLERLVGIHVSANCEPIIISLRKKSSNIPSGCFVAYDADDDEGPLAGLHSAMLAVRSAGCDWAWLSPVDVPLLDPRLLAVLESQKKDGDEAILPISESGDENLLALVEVRATIRVLTQLKKVGLRNVSAIYGLLSCRKVSLEILNSNGIKKSCFLNVNHPRDLRRAENLLTGRQ